MAATRYESNLQTHLQRVLQDSPSKHSLLTFAKHASVVNKEELKGYCEKVIQVDDKADFVLIKMVRLLYFNDDTLVDIQNQIDQSLANFPFWIRKDKKEGQYGPIEKIIFWSENHTFMFLSSAYLFYQRSKKLGLPCLADEHEEGLLRGYLDAHIAFDGVYETLSCTYLPYTINSLLNLFDFADDESLRDKSKLLLDKIISQLLMVCNIDGICNLAASARQYPAFRFRNFQHNVNQLIRLCTGVSSDRVQASSITDFLLTSSYRVSDEIIEQNWMFTGFSNQRANHETSDTIAVYEGTGVDSLSCTPFFWSAGLVTHPRFVSNTKDFLDQYKLHDLPAIKYLNYLPKSLAESAMESYSSLSSGQNYTDIVLNIYKSPNRKVVLSSFENFNVNVRSFQQNPWMANVAGAPLWTQSGSLGKKIIPCINDFCPSVTQKGNILLALYATPKNRDGLISKLFSNNMTFITWPRHYFEVELRAESNGVCGPAPNNLPGHKVSSTMSDDVVVDESTKALLLNDISNGEGKNCWWYGMRESSYVGVYCSHETSEIFTEEKGFPMFQMFEGDPKNILPRRVCYRPNHAWVVVVGDTSTHPSMFDFVSYCQSIEVHVERQGNSSYLGIARDSNWELTTQVLK